MKVINKKEFVGKEVIKCYEEIDGLLVIEELLLYKGVDIAGAAKVVHQKHLDDMALVTYELANLKAWFKMFFDLSHANYSNF